MPVPQAPVAVKLRVSTVSRSFLLGDACPPLPTAVVRRRGVDNVFMRPRRAVLTPEQRSESARKAARQRWRQSSG